MNDVKAARFAGLSPDFAACQLGHSRRIHEGLVALDYVVEDGDNTYVWRRRGKRGAFDHIFVNMMTCWSMPGWT